MLNFTDIDGNIINNDDMVKVVATKGSHSPVVNTDRVMTVTIGVSGIELEDTYGNVIELKELTEKYDTLEIKLLQKAEVMELVESFERKFKEHERLEFSTWDYDGGGAYSYLNGEDVTDEGLILLKVLRTLISGGSLT